MTNHITPEMEIGYQKRLAHEIKVVANKARIRGDHAEAQRLYSIALGNLTEAIAWEQLIESRKVGA
jgi:hypothetical protein